MHFAIISAPVPGHLYPNAMIGRELLRRGHRVTVYNISDDEKFVTKLGLAFQAIAKDKFPMGSIDKKWRRASFKRSLFANLSVLKAHMQIAEKMLTELPQRLLLDKIDILLVDHLQPQGAVLAEKLQLPYATICSTLPMHKDSSGYIPSPLAWWIPKDTVLNKLLNRLSHNLLSFVSFPYMRLVNRYRKRWGLSGKMSLPSSFSPDLQIGVIPKQFDFPGEHLPEQYFAFGPFVENREQQGFPWEKLDGRPLIYASLGTIRNGMTKIFSVIIEAFRQLPQYQLILSKGAWTGKGISLAELPENVIAVEYAPQLEILERASLCITHAGAGTVMECLWHAVPMIAIPLADDQPAMAARIVYHQIGVKLPAKSLNRNKILLAIKKVTESVTIKENVTLMSQNVGGTASLQKACDKIEALRA